MDVLAIGIPQYASRRIDDVLYADRDVKVLGDLLANDYGYTIHPLVGSAATKKAILDYVEKLAKSAQADDALIVYFAGHGRVVDLDSFGRMGFLIPYDAVVDLKQTAEIAEWKEQALAMTDLTAALAKTDARHVVVILDACGSGFITKRGEVAPLRFDQKELLLRKSRTVLAACGENESTYPDPDAQLGTFTAAVVNALKTKRPTGVTELLLEIRKTADSNPKLANRAKLPHMGQFSLDEGEFVFVPVAIPEATVDESLAEMARQKAIQHKR